MYWLRGCYYKLIKKMSSCEQIEQFTGFGLYDKSFIQTLRNLKDPTPFIRGIVAELGPERKEIEYTQPQRRARKITVKSFPITHRTPTTASYPKQTLIKCKHSCNAKA